MTVSWSRSEEDTSSSEDTLRYLDSRLEYSVRVRATTFLWGSSGLTANVTFGAPLILHVGNDRYGREISLFKQVAGGPQPPGLGTLQPGEVVSLPMQDIIGVYATCAEESI